MRWRTEAAEQSRYICALCGETSCLALPDIVEHTHNIPRKHHEKNQQNCIDDGLGMCVGEQNAQPARERIHATTNSEHTMSEYSVIGYSGVAKSDPSERTRMTEKSGSQQVPHAADGLSDQVDNMGEGDKALLQNWTDRYSAWVKKFSD